MALTSIYIERRVKSHIELAAAEVYPLETFAFLRGEFPIVSDCYVLQSVKRSPDGLESDENENWLRVLDELGDDLCGDVHSHPSEPPVLSRIKDFRLWRHKMMSDEWDLLTQPYVDEGFISAIVSVWPGKRKAWRSMWRVYVIEKGRVRLARGVWR